MQELASSEALNNEEEIIVFEENLKGPKGDKGDKGDDGYTPKKGVDYFTENDKQELIEAVTEDASSEFVQIVNSKTTEFNNNATSKTDSFNSNATSKETAYNENATSKLNAYNENSAEKLAEYNENAAEKITEYDDHIEELDNIVSKNTVNGESISIDDALAYKIFGAKVDGNVEQTTTTGKNLLKYQVDHIPGRVVESNGVTFTVNEDYSITINGTNNGNNSVLFIANGLTLPPGTYIGNLNGSGWKLSFQKDSSWLSWNVARTFEEETNLKQVYIEPSSRNQTYDNEIIYPMLVSGDTSPGFAKDVYEPYTGGEPSPNPDYKQAITTLNGDIKIVQIGQNAYNIANRKNPDGYPEISVDENDWVTIDNTTPTRHYVNFFTSNLKLKTDTDYAIVLEVKEASGDGKFILMSDDQDRGQFEETIMFEDIGEMGNNSVQVYIKKSKSSFEKSADGLRSFIETSNGQSNFITFRISVVEDTSITPETFVYKSYESNEYTIDLQDNELAKLTDVMKDDIVIDKIGNATLNKRVGKTILNGTENWFLSNAGTYQVFGLTKNDVAKNNLLSDTFIYYKQVNLIKDRVGITNDNTEQRIYISNGISSTVEEFKAWLSENNVTVYYELLEHQTTNIGTFTNFKTFEGINSFFLETNIGTNFEVTYAQDLQKKTEDLQAQIDELKTLLSSTATSALLLDNYASDLVSEIESEVEQ